MTTATWVRSTVGEVPRTATAVVDRSPAKRSRAAAATTAAMTRATGDSTRIDAGNTRAARGVASAATAADMATSATSVVAAVRTGVRRPDGVGEASLRISPKYRPLKEPGQVQDLG